MAAKVNEKKVDKVYTDIINIFKKSKLTVPELLLVLGNTTYTLGASIAGYKDKEKGPGFEKLQEMYAEKPEISTALMLTGMTETIWVNDLDKKYEEIVEELKNEKAGTD